MSDHILQTERLGWASYSLIFTGGFVCILGVTSLLVWYLQGHSFGKWMNPFVTLNDGASLGFIICGLGLLSSALRNWRLAIFLGFLIIILNLLAIIRFFFILSPETNNILGLLTTGTIQMRPISPNVSLPFLFVGIAIVCIRNVMSQDENSVFLGILGSLIIALGLINFFGANNDILTVYGWAHLSYNAITTAIGFICLGIGVIACAWHKTSGSESGAIRLLPIFIVTIVIIVTLLLWQALISQKSSNIYRMTEIESKAVKNEIISRMQSRVNSLVRMSKRWERSGGTSRHEWEADATAHVLDNFGYVALEWVDRNFNIQWVVPKKGNEAAVNLNAAFEDRRGQALFAASKNRKITMTRAINLLQGGKGFLIYIPLRVKKQFDGFLLAVVRYKPLFNSILRDGIAPGYNIRLYDGDELIYQRNKLEQSLREKWSTYTIINLFGVQWRLQVWPTARILQLEQSALPSLTLVMGLMMALLLGLSIRFAQLAQLRTREMEDSNVDLKREILNRERAEAAKREMEKVLLQSQKIQAIGTLAGGIAHDFNNILYSIIGYVEMARDDSDKQSIIYRNLTNVLEGAKRGQELVSQILSFSRQQQYKFKIVSLRSVMKNTLTLVNPSIPPTVDLEYFLYEGQDNVYGNATQLEQVFINLINNAVDSMEEGGKIILRTSYRENDEGFLRLHPELKQPSYFIIEFQDTGMGMDEATKQRIFEPFFTTKEVNKGTGLGMAIAHGIIHDHNGEITVESTVGIGTSVYIYLPACIEVENGET